MIKFYDTCALLELQDSAFNNSEEVYISSVTLEELENIKTSANKDSDIKYKARNLLRLLLKYQGNYKVVLSPIEENNSNDNRIITTVSLVQRVRDDIKFVTADLACYNLAKIKLGENKVEYIVAADDDRYQGYIEIQPKDEEELALVYLEVYDEDAFNKNKYNMNINEYLLIKDQDNNIIDKYKYTKEGYQKVPFSCFESKMFGKIKPKDTYQLIAMDSLKSNQITMLRGSAGTGKSYIALGYLFSQLEKGKIGKIIIFCNTVATAGAAKLGFYPGSRSDKLLDAQIGNFLTSKLGDRAEVERLVEEGQLELLPMSDIRGYDTSGLNAGVYITEAQNLDVPLLKLALQRIGEDSICILDGDTKAQVDLPIYSGFNNGMRRVSKIFRGQDVYGEVTLKNIYRSKIAEIAELL